MPRPRIEPPILDLLADVGAGRTRADAAAVFGSWPGATVALSDWLVRCDLAPLAHAAARIASPELASSVTAAAFGAAAANLGHFRSLDRIETRFESERIPLVLLKGAAVASHSYANSAYRPMTDLDAWVRDDDMPRAVEALRSLGFRQGGGLASRPEALQRLSGGELVFRPEHGGHGLIELHFSPFQGWWVKRTTAPDLPGMWRRAVVMAPGRYAMRLADDDAILQTALHVAVNQFGQAPLRGLVDLAVMARARAIDWASVAERAVSWRMAQAAWLVLDAADRLIGLPGSRNVLDRMRPSIPARALLRTFVTPRSILNNRDLKRPALRHLFMLALADRRSDGARLIGRALWPELWWITARHGPSAGRWSHMMELLRRGDV